MNTCWYFVIFVNFYAAILRTTEACISQNLYSSRFFENFKFMQRFMPRVYTQLRHKDFFVTQTILIKAYFIIFWVVYALGAHLTETYTCLCLYLKSTVAIWLFRVKIWNCVTIAVQLLLRVLSSNVCNSLLQCIT